MGGESGSQPRRRSHCWTEFAATSVSVDWTSLAAASAIAALLGGASCELRERQELARVGRSRHGHATHEESTNGLTGCEGRKGSDGGQTHALVAEQRSVLVERTDESLRSGKVVERADPVHAAQTVFAGSGG